MKVINAFDSLQITNVVATGNKKTGAVDIKITFSNSYSQAVQATMDLGGFEDGLGIIDDQGLKYKVYTNSKLIGTQNINVGYKPIGSVQFGAKKLDWVTVLQQELQPGESKDMTIRLNKIRPTMRYINLVQVTCNLSKIIYIGRKQYKVNHIAISWN